MSGDWIKMRSDLLTHPKIVRMASALKADRLRTVGGLFAAWCLFDTHSIDGRLDGYTPDALDELIGFPGFSRAMESVDWLSADESGLSAPRFDEHNGQSAKRRAQESERKRDVRKVSASDADKKQTESGLEKRREEKRREEVKTTSQATPAADLFEGVDPQIVADFKAMRTKQKAPITKTAIDGIRRESGKAGISLQAALAMCCERGWRGFNAGWVQQQARASPQGYESARDKSRREAMDQLTGRKQNEQRDPNIIDITPCADFMG